MKPVRCSDPKNNQEKRSINMKRLGYLIPRSSYDLIIWERQSVCSKGVFTIAITFTQVLSGEIQKESRPRAYEGGVEVSDLRLLFLQSQQSGRGGRSRELQESRGRSKGPALAPPAFRRVKMSWPLNSSHRWVPPRRVPPSFLGDDGPEQPVGRGR